MTLAGWLGACDVLTGIVMLWSALHITSAAGWCSLQARWALFRRVVYGGTSVALFALGVGRINGDYPLGGGWEAVCHAMLLVGLVSFPLLRALGWITQDQFRHVDGSYERRSGRAGR